MNIAQEPKRTLLEQCVILLQTFAAPTDGRSVIVEVHSLDHDKRYGDCLQKDTHYLIRLNQTLADNKPDLTMLVLAHEWAHALTWPEGLVYTSHCNAWGVAMARCWRIIVGEMFAPAGPALVATDALACLTPEDREGSPAAACFGPDVSVARPASLQRQSTAHVAAGERRFWIYYSRFNITPPEVKVRVHFDWCAWCNDGQGKEQPGHTGYTRYEVSPAEAEAWDLRNHVFNDAPACAWIGPFRSWSHVLSWSDDHPQLDGQLDRCGHCYR